ncbi:pentapeptide repeat-containing protein, partial [Citrobacter sp. AAK_AS5]
MEDADFASADLTQAIWQGARAARVSFLRAKLYQGNFVAADLSRADLRGADLTYADLSHANLEDANLSGAGLFRAKLHRIRDRGACFTDRAQA